MDRPNKTPRFFLLFLSCFLTFAKAVAELPTVNPAEVGLSGQALTKVDAKMEELIKEQRLAGGIVVIARQGKIAHFKPYGLRDREAKLPMEKDTFSHLLHDQSHHLGRPMLQGRQARVERPAFEVLQPQGPQGRQKRIGFSRRTHRQRPHAPHRGFDLDGPGFLPSIRPTKRPRCWTAERNSTP